MTKQADALDHLPANPAFKPPRAGGSRMIANTLTLIQRPQGASMAEIIEATGWHNRTARTILATIDGRRGIPITSESSAERGIVYRA